MCMSVFARHCAAAVGGAADLYVFEAGSNRRETQAPAAVAGHLMELLDGATLATQVCGGRGCCRPCTCAARLTLTGGQTCLEEVLAALSARGSLPAGAIQVRACVCVCVCVGRGTCARALHVVLSV